MAGRIRISQLRPGNMYRDESGHTFMVCIQYEPAERDRLEQMGLHAVVNMSTGQISHTESKLVRQVEAVA